MAYNGGPESMKLVPEHILVCDDVKPESLSHLLWNTFSHWIHWNILHLLSLPQSQQKARVQRSRLTGWEETFFLNVSLVCFWSARCLTVFNSVCGDTWPKPSASTCLCCPCWGNICSLCCGGSPMYTEGDKELGKSRVSGSNPSKFHGGEWGS